MGKTQANTSRLGEIRGKWRARNEVGNWIHCCSGHEIFGLSASVPIPFTRPGRKDMNRRRGSSVSDSISSRQNKTLYQHPPSSREVCLGTKGEPSRGIPPTYTTQTGKKRKQHGYIGMSQKPPVVFPLIPEDAKESKERIPKQFILTPSSQVSHPSHYRLLFKQRATQRQFPQEYKY